MQGLVKALNFVEGLLVAVSLSTLDTAAGKGQVMVEGWLSRGQSQGQTKAHPHLPGLRAWDWQGPCGSEMPPWPLWWDCKIISPRRDHTQRARLGSFKCSSLQSSSKAQGLRKRNFCPWRKRTGMTSAGGLLQAPAPPLLSLPREAWAQIQQWAYSWWSRFMCPWRRRGV